MGTSPGDGNIIELAHGLHHGALITRGRLCGANGPGHDLHILLVEQRFEPVRFGLAEGGAVAVEEAADHQVRLFRAAMPGAKLHPAQAAFLDHVRSLPPRGAQ